MEQDYDQELFRMDQGLFSLSQQLAHYQDWTLIRILTISSHLPQEPFHIQTLNETMMMLQEELFTDISTKESAGIMLLE